jgi:glucose 1-dehydrogenase
MPETMRAVGVIPGRREVRLVEQPVPAISADTHVKLQMLEVGVCGTDKEICAFEYGTPPAGSDTLVIGHESLGRVVEAGGGVGSLRQGDLVVPMVRRPCPHESCLPCRAGRQDFCSTGDFIERGIKLAHGFMTEYVVEHEKYLVPVPASLRDVAVLVEPLTIAEKALLQLFVAQSRLPWGCPHAATEGPGHCHTAAVLGAGPVGLLGAMAFRARGFDTVVYSREPETSPRADLVRSFGARYVSGATNDVAALAKSAGRVDVVYEAVGVPGLIFELMKFISPNAAFIITGVPAAHGTTSVEGGLILRQMVLGNQLVFGSVNSGRDGFENAIIDLELFDRRWPLALRALITGRYPVEAYQDLLLGQAGGIKNLITVGPADASASTGLASGAPA